MKPYIIPNFINHRYEIYLDDKVRYLDFTKSSQIEIIMNEMIKDRRDILIDKILMMCELNK